MTNDRQLNEPVPAPPIPLLLDDEWEPPPRNRGRVAVIGTLIGIALMVTSVELLRSRARMWEPDDSRVWVPPPPPSPPPPAPPPTAMSPETGRRAERVVGTLSHFDASEPNEVLESPPPPPPRRRPTPRIVERPNRAAGYLSINSSPWAELSVDGHVVGSTPQVRVRVTPGRHHLLLLREGFQTHSAWVTVPAGGTVRLTDITLAGITR